MCYSVGVFIVKLYKKISLVELIICILIPMYHSKYE